MKFRGHETFFIRKGWLYKGIKNIQKDKYVFMGTNGNSMDILGIGANMVKALRYWMQSVGLTQEPTSGKRYQVLTDFGEVVYKNDRYLEEVGTLYLLHYMLAKNEKLATSWYYFFNEFNLNEFNRDDFVFHINNYILMNGSEVSKRSLDDDFNCIINTYLPRVKTNPKKVHPESNIDCPLGELALIDVVNKKDKLYKKSHPKAEAIPPLIALAIIIDNLNGSKQIKISSLLGEKCNIGKVFNLDIISLTHILHQLELMEYVEVIRTAGLDIVNIKMQDTENNFLWCVNKYYEIINR